MRRRKRIILWWWALFLSLFLFSLLRGKMDDLGFPVQGMAWEIRLFGTLPTLWLQERADALPLKAVEWFAVIVHGSWFIVPFLGGLYVSLRHGDKTGSLFKWWMALLAISLPIFSLIPLQPPWMADSDVVRFIALRFGGEINDLNPLAAMPSLHVAVPCLITLFFIRERCRIPAMLMAVYALLVSFEVVLSGEHYVIDALGGLAVAGTVALAARVEYSKVAERLSRLVKPSPTEPVVNQPALAVESQRGQTLVEFALIAPLVILFLVAIIDFGMAMDRRIVLQHAAREGARMAAVTDDIGRVCDHTVEQAQGAVTRSDVEFHYDDLDDNGEYNAGDNVKVTLPYQWNLPILDSALFGLFDRHIAPINLTATASARLERTVPGVEQCP